MRIEHATLSAAAGEPQPVVAEVPKYLCSSSTADAAARQAIHFVTWEKLHGMRCQTRLTEKDGGKRMVVERKVCPQANVYVCAICDFCFATICTYARECRYSCQQGKDKSLCTGMVKSNPVRNHSTFSRGLSAIIAHNKQTK